MNWPGWINGRNLIWLLPLMLFCTFPLWRQPVAVFLAPRGGYDPALNGNQPSSHDFVMNRVHITQSQNGQPTLDLVSERAMTGKSTDEFKMEDIRATIIGKDGEETYVTARHGIFDKASSLLSLIDDVVIKKPRDKYEIYTDLLHYDDRSKIAYCPGATRLKGEKVAIQGGSLSYNTRTRAYEIGGRVHCRLMEFIRP